MTRGPEQAVRGLLVPGVVTLFALGALLLLGAWQWDRMVWKAGLLSELEKAQTAAPIVLKPVPSGSVAAGDLAGLRFRRVEVVGTFEHDREMHVWSPGAQPAWSVVTPLRLKRQEGAGDGAEASHILVIRGVVADVHKTPASREAGQIRGEVRITGRVRLDQPNTWANDPDIKKNQWFTRDLSTMSAHLAAMPGNRSIAVAPFFLEAESQMGGVNAPKPNLKALKLSNRHLEYALTWWGLAATLLVVFLIFAWGRYQGRRG